MPSSHVGTKYSADSASLPSPSSPALNAISGALVEAAQHLCSAVQELSFDAPVTHVYNPLDYAWSAHELYLRRYAATRKRVLFLGMNPGPFGMVQTGVPFGQVVAVRDWLRITAEIRAPAHLHPKRLVTGFQCHRSEISGERLWGLFARRFGSADKFFREHFVANYCPLAFLEASASNRTPEKLPPTERAVLFSLCDKHLRELVRILEPTWVIGVGGFAAQRAAEVFPDQKVRVGCILHPSPASPAANRGWAVTATKQLIDLGVWD